MTTDAVSNPSAPPINFGRRIWPYATLVALAATLVWAIGVQHTLADRDQKIAATVAGYQQLESKYTAAKKIADNVTALQAKANSDEAAAKTAQAKADADEAKAQSDQAAASAALTAVQSSTLKDGDQYTAPATMAPGTYRTTTATSSCYWEILNGASDSSDIVANDVNVGGNITVTVKAGQTFDSKACGDWTKIG